MNNKTILFNIKRIRIPLLVIGLLLSVICCPIILKVASDKGQDAIQLREKAIMAVKGELMPFEMDMSKDFVIDEGGNTVVHSAQELAQGIDATFGIGIGFSWPFKIVFNDNKILISADIIDSNNELVGYIRNNTWKSVSPDSVQIGDRNYNDYAFEIIDANMAPIFDVRVVGPNEIQIGGLFHNGNMTALISNNGGGVWSNPSNQQISALLTPMFNYPSNSHFGELFNPTIAQKSTNILADKAQSESNLFSILGYALAFIGALFVTIFGVEIVVTTKTKETENKRRSKRRHGRR